MPHLLINTSCSKVGGIKDLQLQYKTNRNKLVCFIINVDSIYRVIEWESFAPLFRQFDWTLTLYNPDLRIFAVKSYNCQAITIREPSTCLRYETVCIHFSC